jgi:hypothetical protein
MAGIDRADGAMLLPRMRFAGLRELLSFLTEPAIGASVVAINTPDAALTI